MADVRLHLSRPSSPSIGYDELESDGLGNEQAGVWADHVSSYRKLEYCMFLSLSDWNNIVTRYVLRPFVLCGLFACVDSLSSSRMSPQADHEEGICSVLLGLVLTCCILHDVDTFSSFVKQATHIS